MSHFGNARAFSSFLLLLHLTRGGWSLFIGRLCYEGYEMLYRVSEEIMGRISGSLKKADKKSPGTQQRPTTSAPSAVLRSSRAIVRAVHKALKQAYRTKILHLEASIIDLRVHTPLATRCRENRFTDAAHDREKAR